NPVAAVAAVSPPATTTPAGTITTSPNTKAIAFEPRTGTLAVATTDAIQLYHLGDTLTPTKTVQLKADALTVAGTEFLATGARKLVRLTTDGKTSPATDFRGTPVSATTFDGNTLVALKDERAVAIVKDDRVQRTITGDMMSADQVVSTGKNAA